MGDPGMGLGADARAGTTPQYLTRAAHPRGRRRSGTEARGVRGRAPESGAPGALQKDVRMRAHKFTAPFGDTEITIETATATANC